MNNCKQIVEFDNKYLIYNKNNEQKVLPGWELLGLPVDSIKCSSLEKPISIKL